MDNPTITALREAIAERDEIIARAARLISLLTVRQVISAGDDAITAAGLNPWCINEGLAAGEEKLNSWWLSVPAEQTNIQKNLDALEEMLSVSRSVCGQNHCNCPGSLRVKAAIADVDNATKDADEDV